MSSSPIFMDGQVRNQLSKHRHNHTYTPTHTYTTTKPKTQNITGFVVGWSLNVNKTWCSTVTLQPSVALQGWYHRWLTKWIIPPFGLQLPPPPPLPVSNTFPCAGWELAVQLNRAVCGKTSLIHSHNIFEPTAAWGGGDALKLWHFFWCVVAALSRETSTSRTVAVPAVEPVPKWLTSYFAVFSVP